MDLHMLPLQVGECKMMSLKIGSRTFIQSTQSNQKPVLFIYHDHGSHLTYTTVMLAIENNIIISLPPNCSHALQPLDVGVFKNLKVERKKILKQWFRETRLSSVDKAVFLVA